MFTFRQVESNHSSVSSNGVDSPSAFSRVCSPQAAAKTFWLNALIACADIHLSKRSRVLLAGVFVLSTLLIRRNHCSRLLSAQRTANSRYPSPVSLRARLQRSANPLV